MANYLHTFISGESLTPTKLNNARTVSDIVNADISASAAIAHGKLANITAGQVLLGNASNAPTATALSGDVTVNSSGVTAIAAGAIVNADVSASAAIVDTKLATISTTGKVSNSATTAASANTASAIVTRDASGNFSAGTITASLTGTASVATNIAGGSAGSVPYQSGASTTALLSAGLAGQVLTSNGSGAAPSWQASANLNTNANNLTGGSAGTIPYQSAAGTTAMLSAGTAGRVLTANGAAAPSWEVARYTKVWAQVFGNNSSNGTYSAGASGNTVTITVTGHGLANGSVVDCNFTSGSHNTTAGGSEGTFTVTVTDADTFTVQKSSVGATSGNVVITRQASLVANVNVSSVTDNGVGDYTLNFAGGTFSSANYAITAAQTLRDVLKITAFSSTAATIVTSNVGSGNGDSTVFVMATDL